MRLRSCSRNIITGLACPAEQRASSPSRAPASSDWAPD